MNLTFALDGYVAESTTPMLFVFDGYLYLTPTSSSTTEYTIYKKEEGGRYYDRKHDEEEKKMREKIIEDDNEIFEIIKIWVERCQ